MAWDFLPEERLRHARASAIGFPEAGLYHDLSHALGGYDTDPERRGQVASFTAGYKRERPFYLILFAVLTFSAGVNMRPTDGNTTIGVLGKPGMAERMFAGDQATAAALIPTRFAINGTTGPTSRMPINEVRQRLNILPT